MQLRSKLRTFPKEMHWQTNFNTTMLILNRIQQYMVSDNTISGPYAWCKENCQTHNSLNFDTGQGFSMQQNICHAIYFDIIPEMYITQKYDSLTVVTY